MSETLPKTKFKGTLTIGEAKIPCAVLDNGTRILTESGIARAILGSRSGASIRLKKEQTEAGAPLPVFLTPRGLKPFIDSGFLDGAPRQIHYQDGNRIVSGYDAVLLPKICDVWLRARDAGALQSQQLDKAFKAELLMRGLAQTGIIALVDEATGYQEQRTKDELQRFLSMYLSEERLAWAKTFPDEYYRQLFRLWGWSYNPISVKRPKLVGKLTNKLVYEKLPEGVLDKLREINPVKNPTTHRRGDAHFQYLSTELGQPDLRDHILQLIAVMRASSSKDVFLRNFARAFPSKDGEQLMMEIDEDE